MYDKTSQPEKLSDYWGVTFCVRYQVAIDYRKKEFYHVFLIIYHLKIRIICFFEKNIILLRINRA